MRQTIRAISSRSAITTPATTPLFPPPLDFESSPAHVYTRATTPTYYTVKIEKLSYIYRRLSYLNAPMGVTSTTIPCTHNWIGTPCLPATCVQQRAQQRVSIGGTNRLCQLPPTLLQTFLFLPPGPVHTQTVLQKTGKGPIATDKHTMQTSKCADTATRGTYTHERWWFSKIYTH